MGRAGYAAPHASCSGVEGAKGLNPPHLSREQGGGGQAGRRAGRGAGRCSNRLPREVGPDCLNDEGVAAFPETGDANRAVPSGGAFTSLRASVSQ